MPIPSIKFRVLVIGSLLLGLSAASVDALPLGGVVKSGSAQFDVHDPGVLSITNSPKAIIHWKDFSNQPGEIVRFIQQNADSTVLNRVVGHNPSEIMGQIASNGRVFLINPNGVIFGEHSIIDTQSLLVSTLNITNQDFQDGHYLFTQEGLGHIKNYGLIQAKADGNIVLISTQVENNGLIQTDSGQIILAAGEKLSLSSLDNPEIRFELQSATDKVLNLGELLARSSGVVGVFAGSLQNSGTIEANRVGQDEQGRIVLATRGDIDLQAGSNVTARGSQGGDISLDSHAGVIRITGSADAGSHDSAGENTGLSADTLTGVTLDAQGGSIRATNNTLTLQNGSLKLQSPLETKALDFQSGHLVLGDTARLGVSDRFDWQDGTLSGSESGRLVLAPTAQLKFDGSAIRVLNGPILETPGFSLNQGGLNLQKGTLSTHGWVDLARNTEMLFSGGYFPSGALNNAGLLRVNAPNQTLNLKGGQHTGAFLIGPEASLAFTDQSPAFSEQARILGEGRLQFNTPGELVLPAIAVSAVQLSTDGNMSQARSLDTGSLELSGGHYQLLAANRIDTVSGFAGSLNLRADAGLSVATLNLSDTARFLTDGKLTQTGGLTAASLELAGRGQVVLTDTANQIGHVAGQVDTIKLDNHTSVPGVMGVGALKARGDIELGNHGATYSTGPLASRQGSISLATHSPLTVGGRVDAAGNLSLAAGTGASPDDKLRFEDQTVLTSHNGDVALVFKGPLEGAEPLINTPHGNVSYNGLKTYPSPEFPGHGPNVPADSFPPRTTQTLEDIRFMQNNQVVVLTQQSPGAALAASGNAASAPPPLRTDTRPPPPIGKRPLREMTGNPIARDTSADKTRQAARNCR